MNQREQRAYNHGRRAFAEYGERAFDGATAYRSPVTRRAFREGIEDERRFRASRTITADQRAESLAAIEQLRTFAKTL